MDDKNRLILSASPLWVAQKLEKKPSTAHYTTTQVNKGGRIANRPKNDDLVRLSFPRTGVEVIQTIPETTSNSNR